ncbi:DUF2203 domain-containing protein [Alteribacillus iranensis]|uniref:DUF2203 family protein n=1 Tax=Alteribacillus iranensis TaxID=930128 RepID=A0A1I1ZVC9_9BACI|nr:DUF2203 domain-containing protein [Alteribacillus iranensis]SFE35527.1 hypothetical protein SAMN05192532_101462 [Alteribacillus iranensis]
MAVFKKYFSIEEANEQLPAVREELAHLQLLQRQLRSTYNHLQTLKKSKLEESRKIKDDIFILESSIEFLQIEADSLIRQLEHENIYIKSVSHGLVDFPAIVEGKEVFLCWKQGEEYVTHYHEISTSYENRKKIFATDDDQLGE